jgi:uncharacterized protein (DUF433 family)
MTTLLELPVRDISLSEILAIQAKYPTAMLRVEAENGTQNIKIEEAHTQFPNIISDSDILNGKPCIKGTRISVELIMEWLGTGGSLESIAAKHPLLTTDLVMEAIRYVARFAKNEILIEIRPAA